MSEVTDVEIGKLIQKVDALDKTIRDNNTRLYILLLIFVIFVM